VEEALWKKALAKAHSAGMDSHLRRKEQADNRRHSYGRKAVDRHRHDRKPAGAAVIRS
jgi:hypothetical protein